ncbi:choice-of-anchor D domain-containing protein [bacterium]|nr:choice-of-anchor D domain-containing protein [bacterium]
MKKTILAILLSVLMITTVFALDYSIELVDDYGDGWNGGTVTVNVNGTAVLTDLTIEDGAGPEAHTFSVEGEDIITTVYTAGSYGYENEYQIFNELGVVVAESGQGGATPVNVTYTVPAVIAGTPDVPTLVSPANLATNVPLDTNLEWTTGANTDHAVLYLADNASFTGATEVDPASSPYTTSLANGTTYYWKVVAVSASEIETSSPVRSFTTELGPGNYIWEIIDSFGDGWNGAAMNVLVDGLVVLENITMTSGSSAEFVFSAQMGQTITSNFHTGGGYPSECSFDLYDYEGTLLATGNASTPISYFIPLPGTPDAPTLESPANGATNVTLVSDLEWSIGDNTDSVILYLADNEEFTGATEVQLAHTDTLYTTATLAYNTTYYWKVEALNTVDGYLTSSDVWSFTTEYGVATVPYSENFDSYEFGQQPDGWITLNTTGNTSATSYVSSTNPVSAPRSYYMNNSTVSSGGSLIASTPRMENAGNRVRFSARGASANYSLFVGTMTDPTDENTFTRIDSLLLTATHTQYIVELPAGREVNYISFKHGLGGTYRYIYLDNVVVEEIPTAAVIEFSPESIDCGLYLLGVTTAVAQTITVTNVGAVAAEITEITAGHPSYFEVIDENTLPYILEPQASMTVDVKALTSFVGIHDSYVRFKEKIDMFTFTNHDIDVTSEILSSTGDDHNDPFTLNVASQIIVNHSTSPYNATYAFCTAKSVVYKLSLPQSMIMDISLEGTTWDTKLWVFNSFDQIDTATQNSDAWYYNDDSPGGTGGSRFVEEEKGNSRALWSNMLPSFALAGDYYIIVSGFSTANGPFTMTINTEAIPAPAAASAPYPADDAIDLPTSFNLAWTNAAYTETVDIYFGQAGSMVLVQDNIAAVDEYAVSELDPDREYEWKVVNRNYTGETPAVDVVTWSFTTIGTPPVAATYTAPADDAVDVAVNGNLTWQAVTGAEGYRVYLSTDSLFTTVTPVEQTATTYAYSGAYGQTYYWKVLPYNVVGVPTEGINVWSFTVLEDPFPEADLVLDGVRSINHGMPMEPGTVYTTTQNIYYQADLDFEDSAITSISYLYNSFSAFTEEVDIYMGHTIKNTFADNYDWELDGMTLVFRGTLTATTTEAIVNLELDTPFVYNNTDNLVVTFMAKQAGSQSYSADFYNYAVTGNRSIRVTGSTFYPLSGTIPYGILKAFLPVTGFNYEDLAAEAVFTVSADTLTYVDQIMDEESDPQTVIVSNGGIADLGIVSIAISGTNADQFQLTDTNTYPVTLATAENMSVQVVYAPTTEGDHTAQLEITDNQARVIHTVELVGNSIDTNIYAEDLPWNESFEGNLFGWWAITESTSDYAAITVTTTATNVQHGSKAISFYNSDDLSPNLQLVAPNLVPDMGGYRLRFWMKGTAGSEMILGKYDTDMQVLTAVDTFVVPLTYEQTVIEFEAARANERFVFIPTFDTTYDYVYLDNVTFEETPLLPVAELNVTALDFGDVELTTTSVAEEVTITNVGPGTLNITNVEITGTDAALFAWEYVEETPDMALENGETLELTVTFTPDALGLKEATLVITDDLGSRIRINSASKASNNSRNANEVALTGTGWLPPQGSTCADPLPLTFPAVGVTGNTIDFIDDYSSTWISPNSSYMNGDDVVYQFTLANAMLLNGTITTTGSWIGAFILEDEPNLTTPAVVTLSKTSSGNTLTYANNMIPAGTYYLIISSYPSPQSIDYTINLTADPLPAPVAAAGPSPADEAVDQPTVLTLAWTNAAYTETIDLWFGEVGAREMALVLDDVAAVNTHALTDLTPNTEYAWKVINRNYSGETVDSLVATWTFTTIGSAPEAVTYTAPADESTNRPLSGNLTWSAATGAAGYYVYLSEDETFTGVTPVDQAGASYAYSGLDYLTTYYWKVIPYNVVGQPTEGILVWSFTTIPDPTIPMPITIDFEGSTTVPAAITSNNFSIGTNQHGTTGNVMYKNIYSSSTNGYIQFQSMNNITATSIISLDYRLTNWSAGTVGITSVEGHDYLTIYASTDNGASFDPVDAVNGTDHVDSAEFATFTADISAYAGQSVIFRFEMEDDTVNDYWFDIDNIYFGEPAVTDPDVPVNFTIAMDGASITLTWDAAANANSYNVYGCDTPDGEFVLIEAVDGLTTTLTATDQMKFYSVKASTDMVGPAKRFGRK